MQFNTLLLALGAVSCAVALPANANGALEARVAEPKALDSRSYFLRSAWSVVTDGADETENAAAGDETNNVAAAGEIETAAE